MRRVKSLRRRRNFARSKMGSQKARRPQGRWEVLFGFDRISCENGPGFESRLFIDGRRKLGMAAVGIFDEISSWCTANSVMRERTRDMKRAKPLFSSRDWTQVRRCHRCNETHEAHGERVAACGSCGAKFAPFYFADTTPSVLLRRPFPKDLKKYRPLVGFTEWWSDTAPESDTTHVAS